MIALYLGGCYISSDDKMPDKQQQGMDWSNNDDTAAVIDLLL